MKGGSRGEGEGRGGVQDVGRITYIGDEREGRERERQKDNHIYGNPTIIRHKYCTACYTTGHPQCLHVHVYMCISLLHAYTSSQ